MNSRTRSQEWLEGKKAQCLDPAIIIRQSRRNNAERHDVVAAKIERWKTKELRRRLKEEESHANA